MRLFRLATMILAVSGLGNMATAQTVTVDEGSFRLLVRGQEAGTETFSIRQNGSGESAVVIAVGRVALDTARGGQELNSQLQVAGSALRPAAYEVNMQGASSERIAGRVVGGRFSARITSTAGESMREYLASDGAVVADEGVAHHHYFIAQRVGDAGGRIPLIIPRQSRQVVAQVSARGTESVKLGSGTAQGKHFVVTIAGAPERHFWVDDRGRVLRLEIPDRQFVAERLTAPR